MPKGYISAIETLGLVDGPGIRLVLFLQGCPLRCLYCHNPETQGPIKQKGVKDYSVEDLVTLAKRYRKYFDASGGGVTFSGGEPLMQLEFVLAATKALKAEGFHVALDTCGYGQKLAGASESQYRAHILALLSAVDLVLLDVKATSEFDHVPLTGVSLQGLFTFMALLKQAKTKTLLRHVMVPGYSDSLKAMDRLMQVILPLKSQIEKIEILPYHQYGNDKYSQLNRPNPLANTPEMAPDQARAFESYINCRLKEDHCDEKCLAPFQKLAEGRLG